MVDNNEILSLLLRINRLVTNKVLELNDLFDLLVREFAFRLDELLALLSRRIEETGVDLT